MERVAPPSHPPSLPRRRYPHPLGVTVKRVTPVSKRPPPPVSPQRPPPQNPRRPTNERGSHSSTPHTHTMVVLDSFINRCMTSLDTPTITRLCFFPSFLSLVPLIPRGDVYKCYVRPWWRLRVRMVLSPIPSQRQRVGGLYCRKSSKRCIFNQIMF